MTCEDRRDLLLLYVAHALEPAEREELGRHLATGCLACAAALAEAQAAYDLLGLAPAPAAPPAEAWQRLQERIELAGRAAAPVPAEIGPGAPVPLTRNPRLPWAAAAVAAVIALALGVLFGQAQQRVNAANAALAKALADTEAHEHSLEALNTRFVKLQHQLETITADNHRMFVDLETARKNASDRLEALVRADQFPAVGKEQPDIHGKLFWDRAANAWTLFASNVKALPPGKTYELWIVTADGRKLPAGTANPDASGNLIITTPIPPDAGQLAAAAVTDETAPGVRVARGQLQFLAPIGQ
ncbi:MAG TPA: anti-sigma factor [Phycisphaerae bacterium]|nr:anti-sigma factor [Phycisphaerae bacterium]